MISDIVLSDDLARQIGVLPSVVLAWANEYRANSRPGVMMMVPRKGVRRCLLSLPATVGVLAMAMPARRRQTMRWIDLMMVACDRLRDIQELEEPVTDPAVALLSAALKLAERNDRLSAPLKT